MIWDHLPAHSHLHFVGIGGAGMSAIAEVLLAAGLQVSGCDLAASETTARLAELGAAIQLGHSPAHLEGVQGVVVSAAVPGDNSEVHAARQLGIDVVPRAAMLRELMRGKLGIAISGTHGKTTTTLLVGALLTTAGLDPTVIAGGRLRASGTGARLGQGRYLVAEADEFDRSFLELRPALAVITTIDSDHLDTYGSLAGVADAFVAFAGRVIPPGHIFLGLDDPGVRGILPRLPRRRTTTYGLLPEADFSAEDLESGSAGSRFAVRSRREGVLGTIDLALPGRHNVANVLGAIAVARTLGVAWFDICRAIAGFGGVHRRFERLGSWHGAEVVDDYAHHPTEVAATLAAARQAFPGGRLHAVFQPHLFTRTRDLAAGFGKALLAADRVVVTGIYPAREAPIPGVTGELVAAAARGQGHPDAHYVADPEDAPGLLRAGVGRGDVVLTLGAGDIDHLAHRLAAEAAEEPAR